MSRFEIFMKPQLAREWRTFGVIFGTTAIFSLVAIFTTLQLFYVMPKSRLSGQIGFTPTLKFSQQALAQNPNDTAALRGMAMQSRKNLPAAIGYLKRAVAVEPNNLNNRYLLAVKLGRAGRGAEAIPLLKQVAAGDDINKNLAETSLAKLQKNPQWGAAKLESSALPIAQSQRKRIKSD